MLKHYKAGIKDLPFLLLAIDLIWWILSLFGIDILTYWWIGDIASHSLAFVAFMAFYAYVHRYCLYSWVCIGGLGIVNLLNIANYFLDLQYIQIYVGIILITSLTFAVIKWRNHYFRHFSTKV